jgi:biotin operon repressor
MSTNENPRESAEWGRAKQKVLKRDQHRCQECRRHQGVWSGLDLQVHHILPVENGGGNDITNLVTVCNRCHWRLHRKDPEDNRYPLDLLDGSQATFGKRAERRGRFDLKGKDIEILDVFIKNGPTQLIDIIEETGYSRAVVTKRLDSLKISGYVGKVKRGVYAYIPIDEYWRAQRELEKHGRDDHNPITMEAFDPDKHELVDDPREDDDE